MTASRTASGAASGRRWYARSGHCYGHRRAEQYALPARVSSRGTGIQSCRRIQRRTSRPRRRVAVHRAPGAVRAPRCRQGIRARPQRWPGPRRGFLAARSAGGLCSTARPPLTVGCLASPGGSARRLPGRYSRCPVVGDDGHRPASRASTGTIVEIRELSRLKPRHPRGRKGRGADHGSIEDHPELDPAART